MSRGKALTLGIVTAYALIYVVLVVCGAVWMINSDFPGRVGPSGQLEIVQMPAIFSIVFRLQIGAYLVMAGLLVIYIVHVITTDRVPRDLKALWAIVLFLGGVIAMAVYWYLYIWREPAQASSNSGAAGETSNRAP